MYSKEYLGFIAVGPGGKVYSMLLYDLCKFYGYWRDRLNYLTICKVMDSDHLKYDGNVGNYK